MLHRSIWQVGARGNGLLGAEQLRQTGRHCLGVAVCLGEEGLQLPVLVHQIEQRCVIHRVVGQAFRRIYPLISDEKLVRDRLDLFFGSRQTDEIVGESIARHILRECFRCIALRIDRNQESLGWLDIVRQGPVGIGNPHKGRRTDIRTIGKPEIHKARPSLEVFLGDAFALMIDQAERPANFLIRPCRTPCQRTASSRFNRGLTATGCNQAGRSQYKFLDHAHGQRYAVHERSRQDGQLLQECRRRAMTSLEETHASRESLEQALYSLLPTGLAGVDSARGHARLRTLVALRWFAVAGQTAAVLFVQFGLGFDLPLGLCLTVIAASAWLNVFLSFAMREQRLLRGWEATLQLAFDVVQLAVLIALTGGLSNPFLLFLLAPVTVAATSLRPRYSMLIALLAIFCGALMSVMALELPWRPGMEFELPSLFKGGHFAALAIGILFFVISSARLAEDEARLVRALDAASVVMAREQKLSALGAMAAMTAHELGTPLATIHLVAKELASGFDETDPHHEDVQLMAEQADRCREILRKLSRAREAEDIVHANMPLSALVEEAAAPFKGLGVELRVTYAPGEKGENRVPVIRRSPEILHALGAFIENSVSFADSQVRAVASWTDQQFMVTISDDGPGFSSEVMPKLGEPYVSQRSEAHLHGGDMGLGFFIAKTLIERTGGRIATRNRIPPRHGAIVQAVWPRKALESLDSARIRINDPEAEA